MNIHNKNWAQYEYSYNLANSRENWAPKKKLASRNANMYHVESLVSFVRKHDVIKIGQKQKGKVCALFNQLRFNACCVQRVVEGSVVGSAGSAC